MVEGELRACGWHLLCALEPAFGCNSNQVSCPTHAKLDVVGGNLSASSLQRAVSHFFVLLGNADTSMSQPSTSGTAAPTPAASIRGDTAAAGTAAASAGTAGVVVPEGKVRALACVCMYILHFGPVDHSKDVSLIVVGGSERRIPKCRKP